MKIQDIIKEDVSVGATGSANVGAISMPIGTISTRTGSRPKTRGRPRKKSVKEVSTSDGDQTSPNKPKKIPMIYKQWDIEKLQLEMIKARQQGRLTWRGMQEELNRRIESGKVGKSGARI